MTSIREEKDGTRREIDTPLENGHASRRYVAKGDDEARIYEYAGDDAEGRRVYRHVSSEPILN